MTAPMRPLWRDYVDDPKHGPLPTLLLALTALTGIIDAVSILTLGRVFVANMTGNVVFTGFALAGAPGFSLSASLAALAGFLAGALAGGLLIERWSKHRGILLRNTSTIQFVLVTVTLIVTVISGPPFGDGERIVLSALLALAMGLQNTTARRLAVPELTTTVLTMTLTGIAADVRTTGWRTILRRVLAVVTMLVGAIVGAVLVRHADARWALALVVAILAAVALVSARASRTDAPWHHSAH